MSTLIGRRAVCAALAVAASASAVPAGVEQRVVASTSPPVEAAKRAAQPPLEPQGIVEEVAGADSESDLASAATTGPAMVDTITQRASTVGTDIAPNRLPRCHIRFRSLAERRWVRHVVSSTWGITCDEARRIYRRRPDLRAKMPYSASSTSFATISPSPAATTDGGTASTHRCTVTTIYRRKNWVGLTLFSMRMKQTWDYNYSRVTAAYTPQMFPDTTTLGSVLWNFRGFAHAEDYYHDDSFRFHDSKRWSNFGGGTIGNIGDFGSTLYTKISKAYNGDWATQNKAGVPDCKNP
jgi:hypothetical protein